MMKEFQDIQKINIRLAQKFEKMGYFKEADRIDNMNLMLSQRITIASGAGPTPEQLAAIGKGFEKSVNIGSFTKGIELAIEKLTGKPVALGNILGAPAVATFLSKLFALGILGFEIYDFFSRLSNDMSGVYGDSPKEKGMIAGHLSNVIAGISYLVSISSAGTPLSASSAVVGSLSWIIGYFTKIISESYLTDEVDFNKKEYPGGAEQLLQDAYRKEFPNVKTPWKDVNKDNLTGGELRRLKDRIFKIIKEGNFTATSMQQAYQAIDRAFDKSVITPSARDLAKQRGLMKIPPYKPSGKPLDKDMQRFDVPFTP